MKGKKMAPSKTCHTLEQIRVCFVSLFRIHLSHNKAGVDVKTNFTIIVLVEMVPCLLDNIFMAKMEQIAKTYKTSG